jgi:NAD(P)-dependent dehydrogenase (short-subunit alcohol dehydrogenase family)
MSDVAVVGGATGGLGRAVVARLVADGWTCLALSRRADPGDLPRGTIHVQCDLSDAAQVDSLAARVSATGRWTAAVSCSGGYAPGRAHEIGDTAMLEQLELNLLGPWRLARAAAQAMLGHGGGGRIVLTAGRAAVDVQPNQAGYQLSKVAVARLVEVMARELRDRAITVNAVLPSTMDTPANRAAMPDADHGRWVAVADVAAVVSWLLGGESGVVSGGLVPVYGRA